MRPFRLQSVARLRQMQEDQAAAELLRRTEFRRSADLRTSQAAAALAGTTMPGQADLLSWQSSVAARAAASSMAVEAAATAELARADEVGAQHTWSAARRRTATLAKLADRHHAAQVAAENHAEQLILDEIASQRVRRRQGLA